MNAGDGAAREPRSEDATRGHEPGATSGSPQRPAQRLAGEALTFDLAAEVSRLQGEPAWQRGDRNANTLVKGPTFRVVLTVMKPGARLQEHQVDAPVSLHALTGRLRLTLPSGSLDLTAGQLVALEPGLVHHVEAVEESAFLLTIGERGA